MYGGNQKLKVFEQNIAKGTTDPRVEFCLPKKQVLTPSFSSKILTKLQFQISLELQFQTLDQTLCLKSEQNLAL